MFDIDVDLAVFGASIPKDLSLTITLSLMLSSSWIILSSLLINENQWKRNFLTRVVSISVNTCFAQITTICQWRVEYTFQTLFVFSCLSCHSPGKTQSACTPPSPHAQTETVYWGPSHSASVLKQLMLQYTDSHNTEYTQYKTYQLRHWFLSSANVHVTNAMLLGLTTFHDYSMF